MRKVDENTYLVAENDSAQILFYDPGQATRAIVTFNDMTTYANGRDFWASAACKKLRYRALGVMSKRAEWFPTQSVGELIDRVVAMELVERPITYGFSMGGHAAIKFGRRLNAKYAVALSPQWSIAPRLAPVAVSGYSGNFAEGASEEDVTIYSDQMPPSSFCVYDSKFEPDLWNVSQIEKLGTTHLLNARYMEHFTVLVLASGTRLEDFFCSADSGDLSDLKLKLKSWRKDTVYYLGRMAVSSAQNHKNWSAAIFGRLFDAKPSPSAKRFKFEALIKHGTEQQVIDEIHLLTADELRTESVSQYVLNMLRLHKLSNAYREMLNLVPLEAIPAEERLECCDHLLKTRDFTRLAALTSLIIKQGNNADRAHYLRIVALINLGFADEAEISAISALGKFPQSLPLSICLSNMLLSRKQFAEALQVAERQLEFHHLHPSLLTHLAYVAKNMGQVDVTKFYAQKALEVDPNLEAAKRMLAG